MPVMQTISNELSETQPFKELKIGVCLHLTKETAILLMALHEAGAEVIACASNPLSTQDDVVGYLKHYYDMEIYGKKGMSEAEYKGGLQEVAMKNCDYIIDDGADLTNFILFLERGGTGYVLPKGGLEETTTGVTRIKNMILKYPIIAVNDADTKHLFDNVYGTAQSTIDAIMRATNIMLAGKTFLVIGYGNCGKGLAQRARGMGCIVIVAEIDPIKALQAHMDGFKVMRNHMACFEADVVITVTGGLNVLDYGMVELKDGAIIANAGHFDVEINKVFLKERAKKITQISDDITEYDMWGDEIFPRRIYLLSEGRLVNLSAAEGHPSEVMDMSFANQILGLEYLVKHPIYFEDDKVYNMPVEIDRRVAELKLQTLGIEIDKETEEQIKYRRS